jgi:hypothetical protein
MTQKHTPGPWEARPKGLHDDGSTDGTFIGQVGGGLVARCVTNQGNMQFSECLETAQANARLIAAAPELLRLLTNMLEVFNIDMRPQEIETVQRVIDSAS